MHVKQHLHAAAAAFWREWHRDLRRHAADGGLPYGIRVRLRDAAERALRRSAVQEMRAVVPAFSRRAILASPPIRLSEDERHRGRQMASDAGFVADQPMVIVQGVYRADAWSGAVNVLRGAGYQVAHFRSDAAATGGEGVIDVPPARRAAALDGYLVGTSTFVICSDPALQRDAEARHVPVLRLDAREPFSGYPIRPNGVFTLATPVDLESGRRLDLRELLVPAYLRNRRHYGYQPTGAADLTAAIVEMVDAATSGWREDETQARFRDAVAAAGIALSADVPEMIEWDVAAGFVGAGRLARVQAERAL